MGHVQKYMFGIKCLVEYLFRFIYVYLFMNIFIPDLFLDAAWDVN